MPESSTSSFDRRLDRIEKIANILLPLVVAIVASFYTLRKDHSDEQAQKDLAARDLSQKQYANFTALLPMLLSKDSGTVSTALRVYTVESDLGLEPKELQSLIEDIGKQPEHRAEAQVAIQAADRQSTGKCRSISPGLFLQVANNADQLHNGQALAAQLKTAPGLPPVQGVQRVDAVPPQPQLRYYFSDENNAQADALISALQTHGFRDIQRQDLSRQYLASGCPRPATFELWTGAKAPLQPDGDAHPTP